MNMLKSFRLMNDFITALRANDVENKLKFRVANKIAEQDFDISGTDEDDTLTITLFNERCIVALRNWKKELYKTWMLTDENVGPVAFDVCNYLTGVTK